MDFICFSVNIFEICFIRVEWDYVIEEDFMKVVRKVVDNKKLEIKLDYKFV